MKKAELTLIPSMPIFVAIRLLLRYFLTFLAMHDTHIVVGIASVASLLAIVATLVVIPQLNSEMDDISQRFAFSLLFCPFSA